MCMESTKQKFTLSLPVAIVIAGVLIAGAIVLSKKTPQQGTALNTPLDQALATADAIGIQPRSIKSCIENREMQQRVTRDLENGTALGINGTPYNIIVGPNDVRFAVPGAFPKEFFETVIAIMESGAPRGTVAYEVTDIENIYNAVMVDGVLPLIKNDVTASMIAVDPAVDHIRGNADATYTIVEYSDFECPYCQIHHDTMKELVAENENIAWVYRHLPLTSIHKGAQLKSEAAECIAAAHGTEAFWQFADKNFELLAQQ